MQLARDYARRPRKASNKRIVFRYLQSPVEVVGEERVEGIPIVSGASVGEFVETGLVLRSVGCRCSEIPGVAFDTDRGIVPAENGRVIDARADRSAAWYVTGWAKRGPNGVIGTNRPCAAETFAALLDDLAAGGAGRVIEDAHAIDELLANLAAACIPFEGAGHRLCRTRAR
ncbi:MULTISPECIES: ferredoxin--NADP reductase domain-containing protein [Nocardia]|uniref:hypothetical protein n=1 Tax=Nocardia TaxID=1817 RepID=UPI000D68864F|nr:MULTISPECIES: hypothetical protein [Nocardia]